MDGHLIVVLNRVSDSEVAASAAFDFPNATVVLVGGNPKIHTKALELGRSYFEIEDYKYLNGIFRPDKVYWVNGKGALDVNGPKQSLSNGETVFVVFGESVEGEKIALERSLNAATAVAVVLYSVTSKERPGLSGLDALRL